MEDHPNMPQGTSEKAPSWLPLFTKRRQFDRAAENQTYIEYLESHYDDGDNDEDSNEVEKDEEDWNEDEKKDEVINEEQEEVERKSMGQSKDGACKQHSSTRRFMEGMTGDDDVLLDHDQVDEVAGFCEQPCYGEFRKMGQDRKHVLLDDRHSGGTVADKKGHYRPHMGPLTSREFREAMTREVPKIYSFSVMAEYSHHR